MGLENSEYKSQKKKRDNSYSKYFLLGDLHGFLHLVARRLENFKLLEDLISFLGEGGGGGARPFTSIEPSMMSNLNASQYCLIFEL